MADSSLGAARVAIVGAGAAGSSLAVALYHAGITVDVVISRTANEARRLADRVGAGVVSDQLDELPGPPDILVLAVPDDEVAGVTESLASSNVDWSGCTVMHLSGALASSILEPLERRGAEVMSFHPMVSLHSDSPPEVFAGAWISVEGSESAVGLGRAVGGRLGARVEEVDAATKSVIHAVASMASNYFVTLMAMAVDLLESSSLDPASYEPLLRPLVAGTMSNIDFRNPGDALTGPVARGDEETLRRQLEIVRQHVPEYLAVVAGLAAETVRIAVETERITGRQASALLDLLHDVVDPATS